MIREGLYKVEFKTQIGMGYGVVLIRSGKLWGGDTGMFYIGSYTEDGNKIVANVAIDRHSRTAAIPTSVFGVERANITLTGVVSGDVVTTTGTAREAPGVTFQATLRFLSE